MMSRWKPAALPLLAMTLIQPAIGQTDQQVLDGPLTCRVLHTLSEDPPQVRLEISSFSTLDLRLHEIGLVSMLRNSKTGEAVAFAIPLELQGIQKQLLVRRGQTLVRTFRIGANKQDLKDFVQQGASTIGVYFFNNNGDEKYPCTMRGLDLQRMVAQESKAQKHRTP